MLEYSEIGHFGTFSVSFFSDYGLYTESKNVRNLNQMPGFGFCVQANIQQPGQWTIYFNIGLLEYPHYTSFFA